MDGWKIKTYNSYFKKIIQVQGWIKQQLEYAVRPWAPASCSDH
jgi:hypothetical protein